MNVKRLLFILILGFVITTNSAQVKNDEAPEQNLQQLEGDKEARGKIHAARIGLISSKLGLTPEQAEKFWPIYNEFAERRIQLRKEYKSEQDKMGTAGLTSEQQQKLVDLGLQLKQKEVDLERSYSGRLLKIISADQMLKLPVAEREFQRMLIQQLQQRRALQQRRENLRDRNQLQRQRRN